MLLDISPFSAIEEQYGLHTYSLVRQQIFSLLIEQSGKDYRKEDILALGRAGRLAHPAVSEPKRQESGSPHKNLESLRARLMNVLVPKLLRTSLPYLKTPPRISIGFAMGIHNPLMDPRHIILRIIREALDRAEWEHRTAEMENLQNLKELILNEDILTFYQPIVDLADRKADRI